MTIQMDELGRFWIFDQEDRPFSGPYDDLDKAKFAYPEADFVYTEVY